MVGRREGGREALRHKLAMIEGGDELDLSLQDSSCLNFKKGDTWFCLGDGVLVDLLPGVGEEGCEDGLVKLPHFIDVFSNFGSASLELSSLIVFFISPWLVSLTFSAALFSLLITGSFF